MSNNKMTQEEIDKLLMEKSNDDKETEQTNNEEHPAVEEHKSQIELMKEEKEKMKNNQASADERLTQTEEDVIGELANISFGTASTALSTLLNQKVNITTPKVEVMDSDKVEENELPHVILNVNYVDGLEMENLLIIEKHIANSIADLMMGGNGLVDETKELDEMGLSAVQEAMNQMMGAAATSMSEVFGRMVDISPPSIRLIELQEEIKKVSNKRGTGKFVKISFDLDIGGFIHSKLVQAISVKEAKKMANQWMEIMNFDVVGLDEAEEDYSELITKEEKDVIGEIANISFGSASTALSSMLNQKVSITTPFVEVIDKNEIKDVKELQVVLAVNYVKGLNMENLFVIEQQIANAMADLMLGGTGDVPDKELGEMEISAVQEAMNQMMGSAATSMSEMFDEMVDISPPILKMVELKGEIQKIALDREDGKFIRISFDMDIGGFLHSKLIQVMSIENGKEIANKLLNGTLSKPQDISYVRDVEVEKKKSAGYNGTSLSPLLKDVQVKVEVIFGNTSKPIKDILALEEDDIIALQEEIEEPLKIYANGVLIAEGEIVNVDGCFGVEITNFLKNR